MMFPRSLSDEEVASLDALRSRRIAIGKCDVANRSKESAANEVIRKFSHLDWNPLTLATKSGREVMALYFGDITNEEIFG